MGARRSLGRRFGWLWAAYAVSACGTWLAFDAFPMIAVLVLHAGPAEVSALAAAGLAVGAVVAVSLGPWVESRRKRPVMIVMDLVRCVALLSVPAAYALGRLGLAQLVLVSVVVAASDITFNAAAGAYLKALVRPEDLLVANGRFEATNWITTMLGPTLGGAAIGVFGPVMTVVANAVSFLLSAVGIRAIGGGEPCPVREGRAPERPSARGWLRGAERLRTEVPAALRSEAVSRAAAVSQSDAVSQSEAVSQPEAVSRAEKVPQAENETVSRADNGTVSQIEKVSRSRAGELLDGWRFILADPALRPLFLNTVLVNGLIMATSPLLAVLMLGHLGFAPWQYALAFSAPCLGGLIGSRLARRLVARFGRRRVMLTAGTLRACWSLGLAFVGPGTAGLVLVMAVELGLITSVGVFNPVFATFRLERTAAERVTRTLTAWSVTTKAGIAAMTALWGLLAGLVGTRTAVGTAGVLLLATPLLLLRVDRGHGLGATTDTYGAPHGSGAVRGSEA